MRISCIIPAHNEEGTISAVINSVKKSGLFCEIIVVNDGSTDKTYEILKNERDITFIDLEKNIGKGGAVWHGFQKATGDIILMLDADLVGIEKHHFEKILESILNKEAEVCIGIINHKDKKWSSFFQKAGSVLSGQQAFLADLIKDADIKDTRFGVEMALKNHFKDKGARTKRVILQEVKHILKEEKMGLKKGFGARLKMYGEVGNQVRKNVGGKIKKITSGEVK